MPTYFESGFAHVKIVGTAEDWDETAFSEIEIMNGWRGHEARCPYRGQLRRDFVFDTMHLCTYARTYMPNLDTAALLDVRDMIESWNRVKGFQLPEPAALEIKLERARIVVREIMAYALKRYDESPNLKTQLHLEPEGQTAELRGTLYPLTLDQFQILQGLVAAKGGWCKGAELLPGSRRIDKHIKRLPEPLQAIIESRTNAGYRILTKKRA